jgi:poly(3-hydroxybutyrate) depolymerase
MRGLVLALASLLAIPLHSPAAHAAESEPLPALNIDIRETSLSGLSSGGFMAVQLQVAHSSIVRGVGIIAAGPYYCAQGSVLAATTRCSCTLDSTHTVCSVTPTSTDVPALVDATRRFARDGLIDDPAGLARQRAFILAGGKDKTVPVAVVAQLKEYYGAMGMPAQNLSATTLPESGHGLPTHSYGGACAVTGAPYLNNCGYDAAGKMLEWLHGPLQPARSGQPRGRLVRFDQRPFMPKGLARYWGSGLDSGGWIYIPEACARGEPCRLHVALHGCRQGQSYSASSWWGPWWGAKYGRTFVDHAGYDAWADSNNLVILYPQAATVAFRNPNGCWDWWGYTDGHYADRRGVQVRALRAMIDRLASGARK